MNKTSILRRFPAQVVLVALFVYALTLSRGVTLASLPLAAKVAGWDWRPMSTQPLFWLLTLPLRWLPVGWVSPALNFFSTVCGALVLGILARSLELAEWDRPLQTLKSWQAKLPILLACLICGLEFNFWQEATAASGEMLQLLLFALAVWCLLEYRIAREFRWMQLATLVWGLGMAENWMMLLTLPVFVVLLFWLGKFRILKQELILRLALTGLAGFSIFTILPLVNGLSPHSPWSFGEAWIHALKNFKYLFANIRGEFWRGNRMSSLAVIVFYLVPVLPAIMRLRDEGTFNKCGADQFQVWIYRGLRVMTLLACLWLAFDPVVGPRQIVFKQMSLSLPLLSLDYLAALGGGFLAGNLLLALLAIPKERYGRPGFGEKYLRPATIPGFIVVLVCVSIGLLIRNAPAITLANRQPLAQFGDLALRSLSPGGGIVISDDPQRLMSFQAAAAARGENHQWLAIDMPDLPNAAYRRWLASKHPGDWLTDSVQGDLKPTEMLKLIQGLAQTDRIYYLHPSLGSLFDLFYLQPIGSVFALKAFTDKSVNPPPLTVETIARTEKFWDATAPQLATIQQTVSLKASNLAWIQKNIDARLHLQPVPPKQSRLLGQWYSVALDNWGVQLQRAGQFMPARKRFEQALALNENNLAVRVNLECNTNLASGTNMDLAAVDVLAPQVGNFQQLIRIMTLFGAMDEPSFCYLLGNAFQKSGLPRQAMQQFTRAATLAPDILAPKIALAELYTRYGLEDDAREIIDNVRSKMSSLPDKNNLEVELSLLEADSWLSQTNVANASSALESVLRQHPDDIQIANRVINAYLAFDNYTNALLLIKAQLSKTPDDVHALNTQAAILIKSGNAAAAIPVLDYVLTLTNLTTARLNRASAQLLCQNFAAAETDYHELEKSGIEPGRVSYGLATIAEHRHNTSQAANYLRFCLTNTMPGTFLWRQATARLQALEPNPATK